MSNWNREPRRVGKVLFEETTKDNYTSTSIEIWDNYGNKVFLGGGFTVKDAMVKVIEIAYEIGAGEWEHIGGSCLRRHPQIASKEFIKKHGKLELTKK